MLLKMTKQLSFVEIFVLFRKSFRLPQDVGIMDSVMMRRSQISAFHTPVKNFLLCFLLGAVLPHSALAQTFTQLAGGIPVERNGEPLELPFFGGLDRFLPQFVDIDGDGDVDLFLSDAEGQLVFLENAGSPAAPRFRLIADAFKKLNVQSWFYLVDIDADGDFDLYHANGDNGLTFQRNLGSKSHPNFVLETPTVVTSNDQKVSNQVTSIPAFADIDADGDFDFFTGIITGEIALYQNTGSRTAPAFEFTTGKWQDLLIISFGQALGKSSQVLFGKNHHDAFSHLASRFENRVTKGQRHGANGIEFADIDGDGDLDFFYGDLFHRSVYFFRNEGGPNNPKVAITDTLFPRTSPIQTFGYNVPRFADIDGDGDLDFFVAVLQQNRNNFIFYKNSGIATTPNFQPTTVNFLTMIDAGSNSAPAFADIDADGDQDLFIGNLDGEISFYENTGIPPSGTPAFRWLTDNLPNIQPNLHFSATPAFTDIEGDGDLDLFAGSAFGRIVFYENQGSARNPKFILVTNAFQNISVGSASAPQFVDYDRDGDADLFVGTSFGGAVYLYDNLGSAIQPRFHLKKIIRHAFNVEDGIPFLYDWSGDGILDLFVGERNGAILYYRGVAADSFMFVQKDFAGIDVGFYAVPAFVDINGDRRIDLFIGEGDGGVNFFQGAGSSAVSNPTMPPISFALQAYPNPFHERLNISLRIEGAITEPPRVNIYNLTGAPLAELEMRSTHNGIWQQAWMPAKLNLVAGVYFLHVHFGKTKITQKILFIH
jgi:hypothetical protein